MTRVACLQFASGTDVDANLATCLRMIDQAAGECRPDIMVLPEFCNHISWYDDADHARNVSLPLEGEFLQAVAGRAARHGACVVINVSLRRATYLTISSLLYGPDGVCLSVADKQTLMGHENVWFRRADRHSEVVTTPLGRLAMFPCRDGVTCETPRGLALRGAQLFCDSLNSFAVDEASLHVPARAPENRVFLAAANKVGPLIPEALLDAVSAETHIPRQFLYGAGESQIVSPRGKVLARGPRQGEAVIWADIDLADSDDKRRPDGTDLFATRRPLLYGALVEDTAEDYIGAAADAVDVALLQTGETAQQVLADLPEVVAALPQSCRLAVLPEMPGIVKGPQQSALGLRALEVMQSACCDRPELLLATSLVLPLGDATALTAVLVGTQGVVLRQPVIHGASRYAWSALGQGLETADLPWGRVALLPGDDACHPEWVKAAALAGVHALIAPCALQEDWEADYGLRSRAAENRLCVIASSRPLGDRAGLVASLERDFTLMSEWRERVFDGRINDPIVTEQGLAPGITLAEVHPAAACNKLLSARTDLLLDRPRQLSDTLVASDTGGEYV